MKKLPFILCVLSMICIFSCTKDKDDDPAVVTPTITPSLTTGTFTDSRDSKQYKWVKIGNQTWMQENLAYDTVGSYYYNDSTYYGTTYGKLYNWQTACSVCPSGWRLPSKNDFDTLIAYLGGNSIAGGKMKTTGTTLWQSPNTNATNSSNFSAIPAGGRGHNGGYNSMGLSVAYWTSSEVGTNGVFYNLWNNTEDIQYNEYLKGAYFSVRCIKN